MTYPEHEKLAKVKDQSQAIGQFLEWLEDEKGYAVCEWSDDPWRNEYYRVRKTTEELLAEYFEIDLKKIEQEKREMLESLRRLNRMTKEHESGS